MNILAIGDPHLGNLQKMVERFHYPPNYIEQVARNLKAESPPVDLLLIAGDLVWGKDFSEVLKEFQTLQAFQAKKICFVEGNHDWPWIPEINKMQELFNTPKFYFLSGRAFVLEDVGICGACGTNRESTRKARELKLLQKSLTELARKDFKTGICLMHFPPCSQIFHNPEESFAEDDFLSIIEESGIIDKVVYGHIHLDQLFKINLYLKVDGIELYNTAIDYHNWQPVKIL